MLRNMVTSLLKHEQIVTTDAKAKTVRPLAEKMITLAKQGDLHSRRMALAYMQDKAVTHRLFEEIGGRFTDRQGGYIRIVKKGLRKGDGASLSVVQLVNRSDDGKKGKKKKAKKGTKAPAAATPSSSEENAGAGKEK
jgi:large subunit ribosomal protein L17